MKSRSTAQTLTCTHIGLVFDLVLSCICIEGVIDVWVYTEQLAVLLQYKTSCLCSVSGKDFLNGIWADFIDWKVSVKYRAQKTLHWVTEGHCDVSSCVIDQQPQYVDKLLQDKKILSVWTGLNCLWWHLVFKNNKALRVQSYLCLCVCIFEFHVLVKLSFW